MSLLKAPSLRQRFLVAPLLGLIVLSLLIAAFTYELQRQNALLTQVVDEHLVAFKRDADIFVDLSAQHVALFDLLSSASGSDEGTLYDSAKQRLFAIHDATRRLRQALPAAHSEDASAMAQRGEALALIEAYRRSATAAVEMTTVNVALAPREITLANQRFTAMNRAFEKLLQVELDEVKLHVADRVERNHARTLWVAAGGIAFAVFLIVLSVGLSWLLSRSLEAQISTLGELGDPAERCGMAGGDEVERIGRAIAVFRRTQLDLRESEERFRAAFEQAAVGIGLRGADASDPRWLRVNQKLCEILGYSRDELLQLTASDVIAPEERGHAADCDERLLRGEVAHYAREARYLRKDGAAIWASVSATAVSGPDERARYVMSVVQDITERKAQEERIAALTRIHAVLSGINSTIVRVRDRQQLLDEACRIAVEAGRFALAWIGIVDREAQTLVPLAWHGPGREHADSLVLAIGEGMVHGGTLAAQAIRLKRAAISNDVARDSRILLKSEMTAQGLRSAVVLPLLVDGETAGTFTLVASSPGFFDDGEMKLLHELAGDISFALEHIGKSERLEYLAHYDPQTGLANRKLFRERLDRLIAAGRRDGRKLAVLVADIERFRAINETLGRAAGDELLRQVAARAMQHVGEPGWLARLGADYFACVLPDVEDTEGLLQRVERAYREIFAAPFQLGDTALRVSARCGITLFPADAISADELLRNAEAALKKAKSSGDKYLFYARQMTERGAENLTLENRLRRALEKDEFVLHYQPKVDLQTRAIVGVEALIRWQSRERGLVPPGQFIPLLEETGLILQVGTWALKRAARDHRAWLEQGLRAPRVAVNVSPIQLRQRDFVAVVERAIIDGAGPAGVDLEITESLIMQEVEATIAKLESVRQRLGAKIAIDDFGTGYSSLAYLAKLPVETLKIDRSFIIRMLADANTMTLVQTIISLAHSLRLKVVAEGVDSEEQAKLLRLLRCDEMQGYLISKPVPADELVTMLAKPLGVAA